MKNYFNCFVIIFLVCNITTAQTSNDTIQVSTGWNLIGALTTGSIPDIISTEPPGIIESSFFGYIPGGGYYSADTLKRGSGYWVKVNQSGILIIGSSVPSNCGTVVYGGKIYSTVIIGSQCWLKENLDIGTMIPGMQDQINNGVIEKYCYNNDPNNCNIYGGLYQWNEAMQYSTTPGTQGICPPGWHIPTLTEFQALATTVGNDGNALKAIGQGSGGGAGTNTSGFSALLAGWRDGIGEFHNLTVDVFHWSSSEFNPNEARDFYMYWWSNIIGFGNNYHFFGMVVRCVKD